jgi:flagellar motor switch protein FliN
VGIEPERFMSTYLDCWIDAARSLLSQALAGAPQLVDAREVSFPAGSFGLESTVTGDCRGTFTVILDRALLDAPFLGEGVDQRQAWAELLREIAEAAAGDLLARTGSKLRVEAHAETSEGASSQNGRGFLLKGADRAWMVRVQDGLEASLPAAGNTRPVERSIEHGPALPPREPGLDLLLDVELEATLRFGCRELPLGEVLDLGPGDVVQLDRTVSDPVDLVVGDKIVARGEVVLINGNFGLRVTEVAAPRMRLESIRCLF